jgi:hypothetical protein
MKTVEKFVGVVLIVLLIPLVLLGIGTARQREYTQTVPLVVTASSHTADMTLIKDLFDGDVVNVSAISSNSTNDAPAVYSYASSTKALTVNGLAENAIRTLSVTYTYQALDNTSDALFKNLPLFLIIGVFIVVGIGWWTGRKH